MKLTFIIFCTCLFFGVVAWIRAEILRAELKPNEPSNLMTAEEQEALDNKERLQQELRDHNRKQSHEIGR